MSISFDPSINLGTVLSAVAVIVTIVRSYNKFVARLTRVEIKVNILWTEMLKRNGHSVKPDPDISRFFGIEPPPDSL